MARANTIWLVTDFCLRPLAAFTVKRELVDYLVERDRARPVRPSCQVFRIPDGYNPRNRGIEMLTPVDLIG